MNDTPPQARGPEESGFDAAMRRRYLEAADRLSASTQAQLHQRRRGALSARPAASPLRRYGLAGATACAALFAAVLGLQWQRAERATPIVEAPPAAAVAAADGDADGDGVFDQNPDFYLWLASQDAQTLAME
ncbi:hypothetical protein [Luteimonas aquatica]|uniref:hypothetical protein n=1 Tax=Luteimonas aquatica TaxID=450364 RepID=UPI001F57CB29|nr:hypothetical protein [Luteimonas aquatica]